MLTPLFEYVSEREAAGKRDLGHMKSVGANN